MKEYSKVFCSVNVVAKFCLNIASSLSNKFTLAALHPLAQRSLEVKGTNYLHIFYSRFLPHHKASYLYFIFIFISQFLYHFYFVSPFISALFSSHFYFYLVTHFEMELDDIFSP